MDSRTLAELDLRHLWHPFTQQREWSQTEPLIIERAEGNTLIDIHGQRYLDGVSSLWTSVHGHREPSLDAALIAQLGRVAHSTLLGLSHPSAIELAQALVSVAPPRLSRVFYSDDGSTAVEVALKMAFQFHQNTGSRARTRFAALRDAYHGDTLGAVSVGSIDLFHAIYRPLLFDAIALPAPVTPGGEEEQRCLVAALALLDEHADSLAALIFEPLVQGAAGMKMHSPAFLQTLLHAARERGVLLIADEVAVGFGRLGTLFAMEQVGISPDLLCLAKGIAAGYLPLAATISTERIYEGFLADPSAHRHLFHGHTFTGNPLACAVALQSLALFEQRDVLAQVRRIEAVFAHSLASLASLPQVRAIRHRGVMVGIDLQRPDGGELLPEQRIGHRIALAARPLGAIIRPLGDTLVLNPPLSFTEDEARRLVDIVSEAVQTALPFGTHASQAQTSRAVPAILPQEGSMKTYGFGRDLDLPFDQAIERVTSALKDQGFGVLTRIDVHQVLAAKIGAEIPPYVILGACNPKLAHNAINTEAQIGLLLPCNVLVAARASGGCTVTFADPSVMGEMTGNEALTPLMQEAESKLRAALAAM